jgi:2-polyprenyl-3-methyl-5-hydroxy-6-metoxy-1,4-benzoquinol methylase
VTARLEAAEEARRDALAGRLFEATIGTFDLLAVQLGVELGLYTALRDGGAANAAELAARSGIDARYAREWLEHQAVGGFLDVVPASDEDDSEARQYALPAGHAEALLDPDSPATVAPGPLFVMAAVRTWPALVAAYRSGGGVDWLADPALSEAQELANRPLFRHVFARDWIAAIADVDARLRQPGARVADVACGAGWASIAIAEDYPNATVEGIDLDAPAIERARRHAADAGVADRVTFRVGNAADAALAGQFDLVTIVEAVHDLARPVEVLRAIRAMLKPGGVALIVDEKVAETFTAPGDALERVMYGYSVLFCLANGLADPPSAGTGTVMRPATLRRYALDAGFRNATVLPIEHEVFRLYRLDP